MEGPVLFRNPAGHAGLRQNAKSLIASLTQFVESRVKLAAQESKSAVRYLVTMLVCVVAALVLTLLGFVFLMVFAVVGIAYLLGVWWIWVVLGLALLLFAIALLCLIIARGNLKHPFLRDTTTVLKEDTEWLKNLDQTKSR
ncbi:MAG: phage holin family protein [Spartobacteria bacterium]